MSQTPDPSAAERRANALRRAKTELRNRQDDVAAADARMRQAKQAQASAIREVDEARWNMGHAEVRLDQAESRVRNLEVEP